MRGVWKLRFVPSLLVLSGLLFLAGGDVADAAPFQPRFAASVSNNSPGVPADVTNDYGWGNALEFFPVFQPGTDDREAPNSFATFTPATWGIPDCSPTGSCPYPIGNKTGTVRSTTTLGLLNGACETPVPVTLDGDSQPPYPGPTATTPLLNASTDNSPGNTITAGPNFANLTADNNSTQIMDGAEFWNNLLVALGLPAPRERQVANTNLFGTNIWVDVLHYNPGVVAPAALGFASLLIIQNFNPAATPTPGLITDSCGLSAIAVQSGLAANGAVHRSNPTSPGTKFFFMNSTGDRDADQGPAAPDEPTTFQANARRGFVNNDDTCPFVPNVGSPHVSGTPFNGDSAAEDGAPDGIDNACDPNPEIGDGGDFDSDGFLNRGDNCPLVSNPTQADFGELGPLDPFEVGAQPVDGGPRNDAIGDACDLNPTVADGHFHTRLNVGPLCISVPAGTPGEPFPGAFLDSDGDGYCNLEEVALGSNAGNPNSKPEALAVPTTCSDGVDNDLDGNTDLNDGAGGSAAPTGCQLPMHDLSITRFNGTARVSCAGGTHEYKLHIRNPGAADMGEISVYLDTQPSYVPAGPYDITKFGGYDPGKSAGHVASVTGATVTGSGPINIDGDADVEWLTKAVVSVKQSPAVTDVGFSVTFPAVADCTVGTTDFVITADLCHGNDVAPLGVGPLNGNCAAAATSDGGQDRNNGNDIVSRNVDAEPGAD
jgi:hypothetical protein